MKTVIVIDGESANDLFAVGGKDLKNHFLPKLGVRPGDVVKIHFEEIRRNGKVITMAEALDGKPYDVITSHDNYER